MEESNWGAIVAAIGVSASVVCGAIYAVFTQVMRVLDIHRKDIDAAASANTKLVEDVAKLKAIVKILRKK